MIRDNPSHTLPWQIRRQQERHAQATDVMMNPTIASKKTLTLYSGQVWETAVEIMPVVL